MDRLRVPIPQLAEQLGICFGGEGAAAAHTPSVSGPDDCVRATARIRGEDTTQSLVTSAA